MSVCPMDVWLDMQSMHHQNQARLFRLSHHDYQNGNFWYMSQCIPAYSDKGQNPVTIVGKKGESKYDVIAKAEKRFMEVYEDFRPHAMMQINNICFENGHILPLRELNHRIEI